MGISEEAITKRQNVPEQFRAVPNASGSDDIELIFVDPAQRAAADVDRRNQEITADGDELDRERLAQNAGISNRDHLTGANQQEKNRVAEQERTKANADARMTTLLAMQDQMDGLIAQYNDYGERMAAMQEAREDLASGTPIDDILDREKVQDAIREWEDRTNKKFDRSSADAAGQLDVILADQYNIYSFNRADIKGDIDDLAAKMRKPLENATEIANSADFVFTDALNGIDDSSTKRAAHAAIDQSNTDADLDLYEKMESADSQPESRFAEAGTNSVGSGIAFAPYEGNGACTVKSEFQRCASNEQSQEPVKTVENDQSFNLGFDPKV
tara:strand:- start:1243 stop:2229 length:987 start_codon:yes stop_codon:yes gene_type:complete